MTSLSEPHIVSIGRRTEFVAALHRDPSLSFDYLVERVDIFGNVLEDLTVRTVRGDAATTAASVRHTATDTNPGVFSFSLDRVGDPLVWGADLVRPTMLVTPTLIDGVNALGYGTYSPGQSFGFPQGVFIAATPADDLKSGTTDYDKTPYAVTCYDKTYLLRSELGSAFAANQSDLYVDLVMDLMVRAGIAEADDGSGNLNPAIVRFSGDWAAKTVSSGKARVWLADDSNTFDFITILNALLKASGQRSLYTDSDGYFVIEDIVKPTEQAPAWIFSRTATAHDSDWFANSAVVDEGNEHESDLWNVPNRFVFIQTGLTFTPTATDGSDGKYVIDNVPGDEHYIAGPDQETIGRIIRKVVRLDATGQSDLVKQAEDLYTQAYASAETIRLTTAPWPCAGHLDVFLYADRGLDGPSSRKVQAQGWELPLDGLSPMTWDTSAVMKL